MIWRALCTSAMRLSFEVEAFSKAVLWFKAEKNLCVVCWSWKHNCFYPVFQQTFSDVSPAWFRCLKSHWFVSCFFARDPIQIPHRATYITVNPDDTASKVVSSSPPPSAFKQASLTIALPPNDIIWSSHSFTSCRSFLSAVMSLGSWCVLLGTAAKSADNWLPV